MAKDEQTPLDIGDRVRIKDGGTDIWTIVGSRGDEPRWQIQRGKDATSVQWKNTTDLEFYG
jgi:hypothetical protein